MKQDKYRLGIDIGGTFTDITLFNQGSNEVISLKTPTIPNNITQGVKNGISLLKDKGKSPADIDYFVHGTTVGLNTLIHQTGEPIALFVTDGFRDLLNLQRLRLPVPYDFQSRHPEPLVPRRYVFPIRERLRNDGSVEVPIDHTSLDEAVNEVKESGITRIAVCFLHSYINPIHEQEVAKKIEQLDPSIEVVLSSELWPQMREYERSIMTSVNLYIKSNMESYFKTLKRNLEEEGIYTEPFITQSNGGIMDIGTAESSPIKTLFSGPAAGVTGALQIAKANNLSKVITFDMGGTSADISIIESDQLTYTQSNEIGGYPIMMPSVSINAIGAGGGSYAWIDKGGLLKVGPGSVGADPGPACYGKGDQIALTDAFLLCGYLNPEKFAAGEVTVDPEKSLEMIKPFSDYLNLDAQETADRMIQVAIANMDMEMSSIIEKHGFDPREFTLLSYGGAGPLMANYLADEVQMNRVVIPPQPGTLCATGALSADFIHDEIKTKQALLNEFSMEEINETFSSLQTKAKAWLIQQDPSVLEREELFLSIDARYVNQSYDLDLAIPLTWLDEDNNEQFIESFHKLHLQVYGHNNVNDEIEVINFKVRIVGYTKKPVFQELVGSQHVNSTLNEVEEREVMIRQTKYMAKVYIRAELTTQSIIQGPAIVEQEDSTILVLPNWYGEINNDGDLILQRNKEDNNA